MMKLLLFSIFTVHYICMWHVRMVSTFLVIENLLIRELLANMKQPFALVFPFPLAL